jgi:enoyl-[acyl-carrier-protein] reductase (NADH)
MPRATVTVLLARDIKHANLLETEFAYLVTTRHISENANANNAKERNNKMKTETETVAALRYQGAMDAIWQYRVLAVAGKSALDYVGLIDYLEAVARHMEKLAERGVRTIGTDDIAAVYKDLPIDPDFYPDFDEM